ncbi:MAG: SpoIIE family protein phosphatase [Candidatus Ozemobacteraceae bacterium]
MSTSSQLPFWRSLLRFGLMFSLFILAPILVAFGLFEQGHRRAAEREEREGLGKTRHRFERFIASLDPVTRVQHRFDALRRALWRSGGGPAVLVELQQQGTKRWDMPFDAYLFDSQGKLSTPRTIPLKSRRMGQYLWDEILSRDTPPIWKTGRRDFLGGSYRLWMLRQSRTQVVPLRLVSGDVGLVWDVDPWSADGGLVLVAWKMPTAVELAEAAFRSSRPPPWPLLAVDKQGNISCIGSASGRLEVMSDALDVIPALVRQAGEDGGIWRGHRWIGASAFGCIWYAGFRMEETALQTGRWLVWALFAGLGFVGGRFIWRWIVLGEDRFVSLRLKLVGLFLFALLVPAVGGTHLAVESWRDREAIETSEAISENNKALGTIDDAYLGERDRMQRKMRALLAGDQMVRDPDGYRRRMMDMCRNGDFADVFVRDVTGAIMPVLSNQNDQDHRLGKLLPVFAKVCMERAGLLTVSGKVGVEESFVRQIIEEPSSGFGKLIDMPGEVVILKIVDSSEFIYWTILPEKLRPAAYFMVARRSETAIESFLASSLVRPRAHGKGAIRVFAVRQGDKEFYPAPGYRYPQLRQLARRTTLLGVDRQERVIINGRHWIATTRIGRQLDGVTLLALYPEEIIADRIAALRASAAWVGLTALVIALLTGLVLADSFLLPIGALGAGIAALRRRDTCFRLQVSQKDELGELALAFNSLLENFGEVDEAKIIQNELFPRTPVRIGDYSIHGISRPATDLGGDYFDVAELGPGKFFALIGDVSGHGIAAALVMAMARAIVARHGSGTVDPAVVLAELNHVIRATVKSKRRLMTCAAVWIDTVSHEARLFGCGHPYPFLRHTEGGHMEMLQTSGFPLGSKPVFLQVPLRFALKPGDRLFLYTDGLAESLAEDSSDGFALLMNYIGSRPVLPLEQACDDLLDSHPQTLSGQARPDDFTIVIIERA